MNGTIYRLYVSVGASYQCLQLQIGDDTSPWYELDDSDPTWELSSKLLVAAFSQGWTVEFNTGGIGLHGGTLILGLAVIN